MFTPAPAGSSPGIIFGIVIVIIATLCLVGVLAFTLWRRRKRNVRRPTASASGGPTSYELDTAERSATRIRVNTKLCRIFGTDRMETVSPANPIGNTNGGELEPLTRSTGSDGAILVAPTQIPRRASAPAAINVFTHSVAPQLSAGGPAVRQPRPETEMRELRELLELHQAMHKAGFTVNTLFDRLKRKTATRRRDDRMADASTVASHSAVGEPLPRYE